MGGRGSSSGISVSGKKYGTEYHSILKDGNIKFVKKNGKGSATAPMETMTKGRIYVTVNNQNKLKSVSFYDNKNKRVKQIDLDKAHPIDGKWIKPHTHKGYFHDENGTREITKDEKKFVDNVQKIWNNYNRK